MGVYDCWTHGSSVQVEYPDRLQLIVRYGFGTKIRQEHGTSNWFHFAIPTPTIINNANTKYDVAYLKARTGNPNIQGIKSDPKEAFISKIGFEVSINDSFFIVFSSFFNLPQRFLPQNQKPIHNLMVHQACSPATSAILIL